MKTILQINTVVNWGSTGKIAEGIGQMAIQLGWESYVAFGRKDRSSKSKLIKIGSDWGVRLHGLQTRLFDRHGLGSKKATEELIEQIKVVNPDIIHLHNIHGYYLNIEVLFKYLSSVEIPVVWTLHDCWAMTGHCTHFDSAGCEKWKSQCYSCPQIKEYPESIFVDRSKKNYRLKKELFTSVKNIAIVPVSQWLCGIVNESFLNVYPRHVIYNGVDTEIFKPKSGNQIRNKYSLENRFLLLGVASDWDKKSKRLDDYIQLSKRLQDNSVIVLVGLTKDLIAQLPKNMLGIERTENVDELAQLYSESDVILNLSVEETFGLTTVEGFSCGTPSIVYNCTASPELISEDTGLVVEQGDFDGILNAIRIIKEYGKSHYSKACRDRAVKYYNKTERYQEYIDLYNKLLTEKGKSK